MVLDTNGSVLIISILNVYVGMRLELYCKLALNDYLRNLELEGVDHIEVAHHRRNGRLEPIKGGSVCVELK
jgi:hypothetical protein